VGGRGVEEGCGLPMTTSTSTSTSTSPDFSLGTPNHTPLHPSCLFIIASASSRTRLSSLDDTSTPGLSGINAISVWGFVYPISLVLFS